jgi:hypothetical protein
MSITRRQFLLGTTAGLILPSFYERAYSFFENHGEPLLIVPKGSEETLYACSDFGQPPRLQLQLGAPGEGPPDMTIREFCLKYEEGDPETWWREQWLGADESESIDIDIDMPMDEFAVADRWLREDSCTARAYRYLESLDLGANFNGPNPIGGLDFIDGAYPGNDYLGVEAFDPVSVSLLQQRLNDLGTGIKIEMS